MGRTAFSSTTASPRCSRNLADSTPFRRGSPKAPLLALQTYYALLVTLVAHRFAHGRIDELLPDSPFSWYFVGGIGADRTTDRASDRGLADYRLPEPTSMADGDCDLFKPLYQDLFPRSLAASAWRILHARLARPARARSGRLRGAARPAAARSGLRFGHVPGDGPAAVAAGAGRGERREERGERRRENDVDADPPSPLSPLSSLPSPLRSPSSAST